mmetsp:Transcript_32675/g.79406  ORF Transcript_32675/g.79406 Transcript_32675/m.79406 type:complete len:332 (-) Transcript_32675:176-1171(-)
MTMTLKLIVVVAVTLFSTVLAAPAVVWKKNDIQRTTNDRFLHSSEVVTTLDLMEDVLLSSEDPQQPTISAVVFLVGKSNDGSEQLTELASSGKLPLTYQKYDEAAAVHHYVSGLESTSSVARDSSQNGSKVAKISMSELNNKLSSLGTPSEMEIDMNGGMASPPVSSSSGTSKAAQKKREREISNADVLIVDVNAKRDVEQLDSSVVSTIDSPYVRSVVLAGIRSVDEVKHERYLASKRRMTVMEEKGNQILYNRRRRLEQDEQQNNNADGNNGGDDMSGVYYVYMTPNIFAGLLFMLLFLVITWIGVSCMGAIQGQDTFTDKMPSIGREA